MVKEISSDSYQYGHIGLIIGKSIFYIIILYLSYKIYRKDRNRYARWILILTGILLSVTLLGLIPILKYDEIDIRN